MTSFRLAMATIAVLFFGAVQAMAGNASLVVDARTGRVLSAENPDTLHHPASLTKMMTLYMTFEALHRGQIAWKTPVPVSATAARKPPTKLGVKAGGTITVEEAVYGMIVRSANDAAAAMAERLGGSEEGFARMMNAKARQLGMNRTFFVNASGLPASEQVTTARDMARLAVALMRHYPREYRLFSVQSFAFRGRVIRGHNNLMYRYQGMDGIKTGYTRASGYNLVSAVNDRNRRLIGVVLGGRSARSRDEKMAALLDQHLGRVSSPGRPMIAAASAPRLADVASLPGVSLSYVGTQPAVELSPQRRWPVSSRRIGQPRWRPRVRHHRPAVGAFRFPPHRRRKVRARCSSKRNRPAAQPFSAPPPTPRPQARAEPIA